MKILPINNQNQISHKAVNQKFFKQAKNDFIKYAPYHNIIPIVGNVINYTIYGLMSRQDAIDTLEAIKPYAQNQSVIDDINDRIKDVKDTMHSQ